MPMSDAERVIEVEEEVRGTVLVLRVKGRLDAISAPKAEKQVSESKVSVLSVLLGVERCSSLAPSIASSHNPAPQ